ncbi:MAG TPA: amidohydrolase [Jatrophihabitans sp.]|nr:amidohydrolase [Jatrophihabitans sp.]
MTGNATPAGDVQIVTARRIIAMTEDEPRAFACRGEWIVATGEPAELRSQFPSAEMHDFADATVVPGFNDAHQHPTISAEQSLQVDLSASVVADTAAVTAALRQRAAETPTDEWIVGFGYDPFRSNNGRELTRDDLDAACPEHAVLVVHVTLHTGVLNSRGLEIAGLHTAADAPSGGALDADHAGRLTGVLHDQALYDVAFPAFTRRETVVPPPSAAGLERAFERFVRELNAAGLTSVGDALVGPDGWALMNAVDAAGRLTIRVNALAAYDHFDHFRPLGQGVADAEARLRLGGVKTFADGAVNGGTCLVEEPVIGGDGHGLARMSPAQLREVVREVHDAGWRACVHANGDRAIRYVLDAVADAQQHNPRPDVRHRLEHTSIVNADLVARMRELGTVAVPFAAYALAHGDKLRGYYGPERVEWMFAHRALLDAGIPVASSSDYPCGPFEPLFAMQSCVARRDRTGVPFGTSQRITPHEALGLYSTGAAYASGEEGHKGRLAAGQLADFVVLGADPLAVDPERMTEIPVLETWVGGARVWAASAS